MNKTLSYKLNFRVEDFPINLNDELQKNELENYGITKLGFWGRFLLRPPKDEAIYWAKNCSLSFIDDHYKNGIIPMLETSINVGTELLYGTSAYLSYKDSKLSKFVYQIIGNSYAARLNLERFEERIVEVIGTPVPINNFLKRWIIDEQQLVIEYPDKKSHGYINLLKNQPDSL